MHPDAPPQEMRLTIVADELQASMVCSLLESNGIPCRQQRTPGAGVDWGLANVGMSGHREVLVGIDQLDDARSLLASVEDADEVGGSHVLEATSLPGMSEADERRQLAGMLRLRRGYALAVLLLFGVPLGIGLAYELLYAARAMGG